MKEIKKWIKNSLTLAHSNGSKKLKNPYPFVFPAPSLMILALTKDLYIENSLDNCASVVSFPKSPTKSLKSFSGHSFNVSSIHVSPAAARTNFLVDFVIVILEEAKPPEALSPLAKVLTGLGKGTLNVAAVGWYIEEFSNKLGFTSGPIVTTDDAYENITNKWWKNIRKEKENRERERESEREIAIYKREKGIKIK